MDIPTKYDPALTEDKWYKYWLDKGFFKSIPDNREPYCIVIPPPNVTGVLHMGHMLNNTIQDVLVRRARMLGKNALWLPGTDHASIATEARVVAKLKDEGINKKDLSREEFLKHAWVWKEKHGGIILEQLKKLGASCDWSRTKFTMDDDMSESVINVFIDLYNKGYIYRGVRMVNWDPQAKTAVSDEEVNHKEVNSKLYYVRYKVEGTDNWITIATTRPETILGDTAVCVNPEDERYTHLKGKRIIIPLINRSVPLIFDSYVDKEFGTGALKVTPAHDINDYNLGLKYNLETIDIFNDDGTLNEKAQLFVGKDRFAVRKEIVKTLEEQGHIVKIEDYKNSVGFSERTDAVIEPKLSVQWFVKMQEISKPALEHVMNDDIKLYPPKFKNTYRHWMENVKDWCISRQLWWGQRIPAYYAPNGDFVIAKTIDEAYLKLKANNLNLAIYDIRQDEDVLDTWFSSWLWPISTFDGIRNPENADIKYYYPTNDLITAPEILFFWVARMIIAGYEYLGEKPFKNVYLTGIVRDKLGRKMSKSLGNSPDPIDLIKKYGADGVRVGMLLCSPAGNDLPFDENLTEQGRNFGNKIWNAFRLVKGWEINDNIPQPESAKVAIEWFDAKLNQAIEQINDHFEKYRLSEALMEIYKLFWDDFSAWYLECIKPTYQQPIDRKTLESTNLFFDKLLKLLHPFMPFITEELWQFLSERKDGESIMISEMPKAKKYNLNLVNNFEKAKEVITNIRAIRKEKNIAQKDSIELFLKSSDSTYSQDYNNVMLKLCNISKLETVSEKPNSSVSFLVGINEYFIPIENNINVEEELTKLNAELEYNKGFLKSVLVKLSNEKFVSGAPAKVIEIERKKQADAESKIKSLEEQIASLKN
ncbi:MAG: valine--tRNA ligase [Bacteroidetes bacterium GWA2_31_9]|nr:MAG: valine--tRNA ligase [Bacteroidetes bacterium GWA2_31_9]